MVSRDSSARIFAEYVYSRIPTDVRNTFTESQKSAIRDALMGQHESCRHEFDLRLTIPLFFRKYYFVFLGGRDKRANSLRVELARLNRLPRGFVRSIYLGVVSIGLLIFFIVLAGLMYMLKSFIGIDLFSDFHLGDVLPIDLYDYVKKWRD